MKVRCITHIDFSGGLADGDKRFPAPNVGDLCTVIGETIVHGNIQAYVFAEYKHPFPLYRLVFDKRNFSPLSDIDEMKLVNEKQLVEI